MSAPEFVAWPKIHRLNRTIIITEKIDGTNACVVVTPDGDVYAQSRKRLITPEDDNFGFAAWVAENANVLREVLGEGRHFGEWWGRGIGRGYNQYGKHFSLFNTNRWEWLNAPEGAKPCGGDLRCVPLLAIRTWDGPIIDDTLAELVANGSRLDPDTPAEGIVVFHSQSQSMFKVIADGTTEGGKTWGGDAA